MIYRSIAHPLAWREDRPVGLRRSRFVRRERELPFDNVSFVCREQRLPPSPSTIVVGETLMTIKDRARLEHLKEKHGYTA